MRVWPGRDYGCSYLVSLIKEGVHHSPPQELGTHGRIYEHVPVEGEHAMAHVLAHELGKT